MSRSLPNPPLQNMTLTQLQAQLLSTETITDRSPRDWFERARHEADLAVIAERKNKKEEMFLAYTRACTAYANARMHPDFNSLKKDDPHWSSRVKEFKTTYEAYLHKAKDIKEALKARDVERAGNGNGTDTPTGSTGGQSSSSRPAVSRHPSGLETESIGSIADRMKALSGRGLDVGGPIPKRSSMGPPSSPHSAGRNTGVSVTGGAGNFGPARLVGTGGRRDRAGSGSSIDQPPGSGTPTASGSRSRAPSIPQKPVNLPHTGNNDHHSPVLPPSVPKQSTGEDKPAVRPTVTGSSSRSNRSEHDTPLSPHLSGSSANAPPMSPSHSGTSGKFQQPSGPSRSPLPSIPQGLVPDEGHTPEQTQPSQGREVPALEDFEKAFPSMSEFSKQFEQPDLLPPAGISNGLPAKSSPSEHHPSLLDDDNNEEDHSGLPSFPTVPTFNLPSVPTHTPSSKPPIAPKPSLPPPPSRPRDLKPDASEGPPLADIDMNGDLRRPASTPNVATLPGDIDSININNDSIEAHAEDKLPDGIPPSLRPAPPPDNHRKLTNGLSSPPTTAGISPGLGPGGPTLSFPAAKPAPPPSGSGAPTEQPLKELPPKPKFPFANSIEPDLLRSYILHPSVNLLILDTRPEDEYKKGYVGQEYEPKGYPVQVVWMDPTVLMRSEMTGTKFEDSLSLSPEIQRKTFEMRDKADIVVIYDTQSTNWPRKGSTPNPISRLWDIIYEHEFNKKLERNPVLLTGGYEAWIKFIGMRQARHHGGAAPGQGHMSNGSVSVGGQKGAYNQKGVLNGFERLPTSPPPPSDRAAITPGSDAGKRANRDVPVYQAAHYAKNITDSFGYGPQSMSGESSYSGHPSRSYLTSPPLVPNRSSHSPSNSISSPPPPHSSHSPHSSSHYNAQPIPAPPQASLHPGPGARRRSDYVEHSTQAYSGYTSPPPPLSPRQSGSIDYPQAHPLNGGFSSVPVPKMPMPTQSHVSERYDNRPVGVARSPSVRQLEQMGRDGDDMRFWNDVVLGLTGLKNLGNSCYMNSTLQCMSATYPFTSFFLDGSYKKSINVYNPLGTKGNLANAFAELLKALWKEDYTFLSPVTFRKNIVGFAPQFSGTDQHDSQEFLSFVLDGLHEDLNRIKHRPPPVEMTPEREAALESLPPEVASEKEWQIYKQRNDSFIVDLFQGQYRNRLECLTCHKTSTTFDTFMYMSLPVPSGRKAVVVQELIDEFVRAEIMEKEDAWNCPRCKVPRRASKTLTIARLPPVLLIQLKRFSTKNGVFWDKSETPVIFPVKGLDLTRYVPGRAPSGREDLDDPRTQLQPYKYDLYAVSNHMGTLSSGHYTAYVKSSKGWQYCDDSKITPCQEKDVVTKPAYILFYKRIRT